MRYVWGLDLWVPLGSVIRFWVSLMENLGVFGYFPCRKEFRFWVSLMENLGVFGYFPCRKEFRFWVCFVLKHNRFRYCFY